MNDIESMRIELLSATAALAAEYEKKFAGDPEGELRAWLHVAVRREAMVSRVYGEAERSYRISEPRQPAADVAWEAMTLIWQHEETHTKFLEVRMKDGFFREKHIAADLMIWIGHLEGRMLTALTGSGMRRAFAKLLAQLGSVIAPSSESDFALGLSELDIREFFLLAAILETTAHQSYGRMAELAGRLASSHSETRHQLQLKNLTNELHLKILDEAFHEQSFLEMASWITNGQFDSALTEALCARRLANLLPPGSRTTRDPNKWIVATDGGLGKLFRKRRISVEVG